MDPFSSTSLVKLCVVGAGVHARLYHLPAIRHFVNLHPAEIELGGICDLEISRAQEVGKDFGFRSYSDVREMIRTEKPTAVIAVTSVKFNAAVARMLIEADIPCLIEKPLAADLPTARALAHQAEGKRVMVSMNRRFDPLLQRALLWLGDRQVRYLRITMVRHNRQEPLFLEQTGLHVVDVARMLNGEINSSAGSSQVVGGSDWSHVRLEFEDDSKGLIDILPTAGGNGEFIELFGAGFRVEIRPAEFDGNVWRAWQDGDLVCEESLPAGTPQYIANGTYAETESFLSCLRERKPMRPTPADILPSMEICHDLTMRMRATGALTN